MPLEQVVFEGVGVEVRGGVLGELGGFLDCEERESVCSEWTRLGLAKRFLSGDDADVEGSVR